MHHIAMELQARARMDDLHAEAARRRRLAGRRPSRRPVRVRAGRALMRVGARLAAAPAPPLAAAPAQAHGAGSRPAAGGAASPC